eukprot:Pompholyxophrys_punicea_v1_NODE_388_length_2079_cov_3.655632.p1 type:complete len:424 gc:universal NODE_388_length_2079_cov_3.655632:580-1851(+)
MGNLFALVLLTLATGSFVPNLVTNQALTAPVFSQTTTNEPCFIALGSTARVGKQQGGAICCVHGGVMVANNACQYSSGCNSATRLDLNFATSSATFAEGSNCWGECYEDVLVDCPEWPVTPALIVSSSNAAVLISFVVDVPQNSLVDVRCIVDTNGTSADLTDMDVFWNNQNAVDSTFAQSSVYTFSMECCDVSQPYYGACSMKRHSGPNCPVVRTNPPSLVPCFPGYSQVLLADGSKVKVEDLKLGDMVQCVVANIVTYCSLNSWINVQPMASAVFVGITYDDPSFANPLHATFDHFIFRVEGNFSDSTRRPAGNFVPAGQLVVGDWIVIVIEGSFHGVQITNINLSTQQGFYSPLIFGTQMVVENVLVSSYSHHAPYTISFQYAAFSPIWQNIDIYYLLNTPSKSQIIGVNPFLPLVQSAA